jgi:hypothetical protein
VKTYTENIYKSYPALKIGTTDFLRNVGVVYQTTTYSLNELISYKLCCIAICCVGLGFNSDLRDLLQ